jgi:pimeloyl-ACP methyl ester carboxylesterase
LFLWHSDSSLCGFCDRRDEGSFARQHTNPHSEESLCYNNSEVEGTVTKLTLVLLPGLDGTAELFANFLPEVPPGLDVIAAAYPRKKFLSYPELVTWLGDVVPKDRPYVLLGESYGSPLAVMFAAQRPANLAAVILCVGFISNPVKKWGFIPRLLARPLFFQFNPPMLAFKFFIAGMDAPDSLIRAVERATRSVSARVLAQRAAATVNCDATREIREVNVPLLYLQAANDRLVEKECLEEIKRVHPATVAVSLRGPHLLLQREPRLAWQAIAQFISAHCPRYDLGMDSSAASQV